MDETFDFEAYRRHTHRRVAEGLRRECTPKGIAGVVADLVATAEATLAERQDREERRHIACRPGCGTCCVVNVTVLSPEAVAIAEYVEGAFGEVQRRALRRRLAELHAAIRWLDDEERLFLRRSCAFLDGEGRCSIYRVRPLLCRSVTSADAQACLRAVTLPALGESPPVLMNQFQKSLMDSTFRGMADALEELGLDARGKRLTESVKDLLDPSGS